LESHCGAQRWKWGIYNSRLYTTAIHNHTKKPTPLKKEKKKGRERRRTTELM
jgi:hypothetical protein